MASLLLKSYFWGGVKQLLLETGLCLQAMGHQIKKNHIQILNVFTISCTQSHCFALLPGCILGIDLMPLLSFDLEFFD